MTVKMIKYEFKQMSPVLLVAFIALFFVATNVAFSILCGYKIYKMQIKPLVQAIFHMATISNNCYFP